MKLSYVDLLGNGLRHTIEATVTTDHPASSYGIPVVVLPDGESLDIQSWMILLYQVEQATAAEIDALKRALSPYTQPTVSENARRAGSTKSAAKSAAARANGRKGGRPRKTPPTETEP